MSPLSLSDTVRDILTARVYDVAVESPLDHADSLSDQLGCEVYLKREDLQPVHSFKLRGAYNKMSQLTTAERTRGVIAASAGNHAQGVALAAKKLGLSSVIVMPRTTPDIKVRAVKRLGAKVVLSGDSYSEAAEHCAVLTRTSGRVFIHPFDDPLVIAGQGTIGREILEQLPDVSHIFVPVGGGGLIAGIAEYVKALRPTVQIIGVEPVDSAAMGSSLAKNERVTLEHVGIFADGVAVKQVGEHAFATARQLIDGCITVTTDQICSAIKDTFEVTRSIVEPSGALALAGLKTFRLPDDAKAVAICSGANVSFERLQQIAERTLIGSGREALFAIGMPEEPGALHRFCTEIVAKRSITEFAYRLGNREGAQVLVGVTVTGPDDRTALVRCIRRAGFGCTDMSDSEVAKEHIRHMVGGKKRASENECLYQIDFPERPGALTDFLGGLGNRWNISLFHYRSAASDIGSVLIGFESDDRKALETALKEIGYGFSLMSDDTVVRMFC